MKRIALTALVALTCLGIAGPGQGRPADDWHTLLMRRAAVFGHRNWVVVADSAYPAQTRAGIETITTGTDHLEVLQIVTQVLAEAKHVRPVVYLDAELPFVTEKDAAGIDKLR